MECQFNKDMKDNHYNLGLLLHLLFVSITLHLHSMCRLAWYRCIMLSQIAIIDMNINSLWDAHPLVAHGKCWKITCQIKDMVRKEVNQTPNTNAFAITLASNKTFLFKHLWNDDSEGPMELLKGKRLHKGMENFFTLCSPNVWNLIASLKHYPRIQGYINNILATMNFYYQCWVGIIFFWYPLDSIFTTCSSSHILISFKKLYTS
jgi:hypothetical protein